jgi:hypothetical protein
MIFILEVLDSNFALGTDVFVERRWEGRGYFTTLLVARQYEYIMSNGRMIDE